MKKENIYKLTTGVLILVLLIVLGFIFTGSLAQDSYDAGFSDGQISVAVEQTQTGNVFIVNNRTIESYPIQQICGGNLK